MTPREPDRFDAQAYEARMRCEHEPLICGTCLAAALRAAEASALERAAQIAAEWCGCARAVRALIPPAAAPAAETGKAQALDADADLDAAVRRVYAHYGTDMKRFLADVRARAAPPKEPPAP